MQSFRNRRSVRRMMIGGVFAATLAVGVGLGTVLTSGEAEAQQDYTFNSEVIMLHWVKAGATADFEAVMRKLSDALEQSQNTQVNRQAQKRGWKVYRAADDIMGRGAMYVYVIDPVVAGANYAESIIIDEVFPAETQSLYESLVGAYQSDGQLTTWRTNLTPVAGF